MTFNRSGAGRFGAGLVGFAAASALVMAASSASAADLGGDCCADLEERIAELEATAARKGNRKVSLTVAGQVNTMVLFWDDGFEENAYVVGNKNDQTNFSFAGDAKVSADLTAGFELVLRVRDTLSDAVDQTSDDDVTGDGNFQIWQSNVYLKSKTFGNFTLGQASRVSDTAPETDLSEAGVAGYAGVQDVGGTFILRRADGLLAAPVWGDVYNHFNGDTANLVRWDSPELAGFVLAASFGEDDIWDVGVRYEGEAAGFKLGAAIAYTQVTDTDGAFADVDNSTVVGSASILHEPTGLNVTVSAGLREYDQNVLDEDGIARAPADTKFLYLKGGWLAKLNPLGPTAFYGEYGWFEDFISAGVDLPGVASLSFSGLGSCAVAGVACRVTGNEAEVWGLGVVQHIEAAEMQIYLGYRRHTAEFDLVDGAGTGVAAAKIEDFDTLIVGSKIGF